MNDRAPIRDRTLILRILVPGLEARLRDKMKETADNKTKDSVLDLEGVTCEPTAARNQTIWSFHCDGATYPARLVNLPCPVELHKTHDHAAYYKSVDIAQMLIVYEDDMALDEADEKPVDGFPSYYHSGLTPPLHRVVEKKYAAREHTAVAPPRQAVQDVETELIRLMEKIAAQESNKTKRNKAVPLLTAANKIVEEVVEEVVDYEPWMDDYGNQVTGVEFTADEQLCSLHPEVWLDPETIRQVRDAEEAAKQKKQAAADKKKQAKKKKQDLAANNAAIAAAAVLPNMDEEVDEVTQAAMDMAANTDSLDLDDDNLFKDLDLDGDDLMKLGDMDFNL